MLATVARWVVVAATTLLVAACVSEGTEPAGDAAGATAAVGKAPDPGAERDTEADALIASDPPAGPDALVGFWDVDLPTGGSTPARLSGGATFYLGCGQVSAGVAGHPDGRLVATGAGGSSGCGQPFEAGNVMGWLSDVARATADGDRRHLVDGDGTVLATLHPRDGLPERLDLSEVHHEPPEAPVPVPTVPPGLDAGAAPAGPDVAVGRWEWPEAPPHDQLPPNLELAPDGELFVSDGCNAAAGRWSGAADGSVVTVAGVHTAAGCWGPPLIDWLARTTHLALDDDLLVLLDADGAEIGRLRSVSATSR